MKLFVCLVLVYLASVNAQWENVKSPLDSPLYKEFWDKISISSPNKFNRTGRITGGNIANRFQFPFQAGLLTYDSWGNGYICGGSLISKNYILTAAHCLEDMNSVEVHLGAHELFKNDAKWRQTFPRSSMKIHENYDSRYIANDVGLIKISGLNLIPGQIETVNILPRSLENEHFIGKSGRVSGWGVYSDNAGVSQILRYVDLNIKEKKVCSDVFGTAVVRDSNVCTTATKPKSTCGGDSGGPLTVEVGSSRYQIGVVSYGAAAGCELGYPSVFSRVGSFLDWISKNSDL